MNIEDFAYYLRRLRDDPSRLVKIISSKNSRLILVNLFWEHLGQILGEVEGVDVFIHDSLHTYQNMMWEYQTVWPKISKDGYLCSDDIFCNRAFADLCKALGKKVK